MSERAACKIISYEAWVRGYRDIQDLYDALGNPKHTIVNISRSCFDYVVVVKVREPDQEGDGE